jgi:hypothetical protein
MDNRYPPKAILLILSSYYSRISYFIFEQAAKDSTAYCLCLSGIAFLLASQTQLSHLRGSVELCFNARSKGRHCPAIPA